MASFSCDNRCSEQDTDRRKWLLARPSHNQNQITSDAQSWLKRASWDDVVKRKLAASHRSVWWTERVTAFAFGPGLLLGLRDRLFALRK